MNRNLLTAPLIIGLLTLATPAFSEDWTRFRGPNGTGLSEAKDIPVSWGDKDYNWKTDFPGVGHSQPVAWGERIFLTSAEKKGEVRHVLCFSTLDGSILWKKTYDNRTHRKHRLNSFASSTPAVSKDALYVIFGNPEAVTIHALDHSGKELWKHSLGKFTSLHGHGASPILYKDMILFGHHQGRNAEDSLKSYLVALDAKTGKVRWKTPQKTRYVSYSTPCIYKPAGKPEQVIFNSTGNGIGGIDPKNGKVLWENDCFTMRSCSSPVIAGDVIMGTCGSGGGGNYLVAVTPEKGKVKEVYRLKKAVAYVPTPLIRNDLMFIFSDKVDVASCYQASTGKTMWQKRVDAIFWGSPVCVQ
ncbi:MAG: PQQ-binding-like beta-propeller repeat protein, partial [Planctomycetota bacterium]|nr:PQQ-binding-like beta-propeller repeat protein [Planctomycetota bacterium]